MPKPRRSLARGRQRLIRPEHAARPIDGRPFSLREKLGLRSTMRVALRVVQRRLVLRAPRDDSKGQQQSKNDRCCTLTIWFVAAAQGTAPQAERTSCWLSGKPKARKAAHKEQARRGDLREHGRRSAQQTWTVQVVLPWRLRMIGRPRHGSIRLRFTQRQQTGRKVHGLRRPLRLEVLVQRSARRRALVGRQFRHRGDGRLHARATVVLRQLPPQSPRKHGNSKKQQHTLHSA